MMIIFELQYWV